MGEDVAVRPAQQEEGVGDGLGVADGDGCRRRRRARQRDREQDTEPPSAHAKHSHHRPARGRNAMASLYGLTLRSDGFSYQRARKDAAQRARMFQ
jgi:hypothetical protein